MRREAASLAPQAPWGYSGTPWHERLIGGHGASKGDVGQSWRRPGDLFSGLKVRGFVIKGDYIEG
jgi:hypothetical protein